MRRALNLFFALLLSFSLQSFAQEDLESLLEGETAVVTQSGKKSGLAGIVFRSLGTPNPDQSVFIRYLEANDWAKALLQFPAAFEGTVFGKSESGQALHAYLYFKNGLQSVGLERLFSIAQPQKIQPDLASLWKSEAPEGHIVWNVSNVQWNKDWEAFWGDSIVLSTKVASLDLGNIDQIKSLVEKAPESSSVRGQLEWKLILAYSLNNQADKAAKLLAVLMKRAKPSIGLDLMNMTAGRLLFQNGYFEAALKYYEKVPKASEYWTQAQEEMAWTYLKKGEPQNSLALSTSLALPEMGGLVGPEAHFVKSISQLKVCDYPGVLTSLQQFPKTYKQRSAALSELSQDANKPQVIAALDKLKKQRVYAQDLSSVNKPLPRSFVWDQKLFVLAQNQVHLEQEQAAAEALYAKSLAQTGLQGVFDTVKKSSEMKVQKAKAASLDRVKELAQDELGETKQVLQKLHIIEAEVIQQVAVAERVTKGLDGKETLKVGTTGSKAKDVLRFPAENEVWFDELGSYKADIKKGCEVKKKSM